MYCSYIRPFGKRGEIKFVSVLQTVRRINFFVFFFFLIRIAKGKIEENLVVVLFAVMNWIGFLVKIVRSLWNL